MKKILFTGCRASGKLHLGNFLGTMKNWLEYQKKYQCIFAVVDYHSITTPFKPQELREDIQDAIIDFLACGLNPKKSTIIIQSYLPQHLELAWILGTITPVSWLERVPTYKEKLDFHPQYRNLGLLAYPVLMAADILIYKAQIVPIGEDQLPHLEFTRAIAKKFNQTFGETFPIPEAIVPKVGARVMSLTYPNKKMSKSLGPSSYIALGDSPSAIEKKIKSAVTDIGGGKQKFGGENLLNLFELFFSDQKKIKEFKTQYNQGRLRYSKLKPLLSEAIIKVLKPIQEKRNKLLKDEKYVRRVLDEGASRAKKIAKKNLEEVKKKIGLL